MMRIILAQLNFHMGVIANNADKIIRICQQYQTDVDLIIFPELALTGYPPEDLLLRDDFYQQVEQALIHIQHCVDDCHIVIGHPQRTDQGVYNSASLFYQDQCIARYDKMCLPNYAVFDEKRYFIPGNKACIFTVKSTRFAMTLCEDLWEQQPVQLALEQQVDAIISLNASPFTLTKAQQRLTILQQRVRETQRPIFYVNLVGGQDELVFDGGSMLLDTQGNIVQQAPFFQENLLTIDFNQVHPPSPIAIKPLNESALIYQALVLSTHDYIKKNGFDGVLIGLSGGIDSALTLAIAHDALGADKVHAVMMPSRYTANMSLEDAQQQAQNLSVKYSVIEIEPMFNSFLAALAPEFKELPTDATEENIQARCRGVLLMALSNKLGKLVLSTSNKSEMAVGYATLYGDMAGGFAVLKDVLKTQVYQLAQYRNQLSPIIPERVITRPPSAELAHEQTDQDTLPAYETLDAIIQLYVEQNVHPEAIIQQGFDTEAVSTVIQRIKHNEYKRHQAPPGPRITERAFGKDWRLPITSGF